MVIFLFIIAIEKGIGFLVAPLGGDLICSNSPSLGCVWHPCSQLLSLSLLDNKGTEAGGAASSGADYGRKGGMGA